MALHVIQPMRQIDYNEPKQPILLPLLLSKVVAGFPSPAEDHVEKELNPNDYLIENKTATFFMQMQGNALIEIGILHKDILVIDRSRIARTGDIVVASLNGEFVARTLRHLPNGNPCLLPANPSCAAIEIDHEQSCEIWGVVIGSMRKLK